MASHRKPKEFILKRLTKRQWMRIAAGSAAAALLIGGGIVSRDFYQTNPTHAQQSISSYSATKSDEVNAFKAASRGDARGSDANTAYVKVVINGESRLVLGTDFTDVKSVLDQGSITLEPEDSVSPSLDTKVTESTTITIERAGSTIETADTEIPFNTVEEKTDSLPAGTTKVKTEGEAGVMEATNLVTKSGGNVVSSNTISSYVKKAPVDKVVLIGTGSTTPSTPSTSNKSDAGSSDASSNDIGTTIPASDMQQWAHDYLLSNGYTEADFTGMVYIINHESGWNVTATNASSGAYGLPQALPGSKMASAGADWKTNYQTQLKWFIGYCNDRYGGVQQAYTYWLSHHSY